MNFTPATNTLLSCTLNVNYVFSIKLPYITETKTGISHKVNTLRCPYPSIFVPTLEIGVQGSEGVNSKVEFL